MKKLISIYTLIAIATVGMTAVAQLVQDEFAANTTFYLGYDLGMARADREGFVDYTTYQTTEGVSVTFKPIDYQFKMIEPNRIIVRSGFPYRYKEVIGERHSFVDGNHLNRNPENDRTYLQITACPYLTKEERVKYLTNAQGKVELKPLPPCIRVDVNMTSDKLYSIIKPKKRGYFDVFTKYTDGLFVENKADAKSYPFPQDTSMPEVRSSPLYRKGDQATPSTELLSWISSTISDGRWIPLSDGTRMLCYVSNPGGVSEGPFQLGILSGWREEWILRKGQPHLFLELVSASNTIKIKCDALESNVKSASMIQYFEDHIASEETKPKAVRISFDDPTETIWE